VCVTSSRGSTAAVTHRSDQNEPRRERIDFVHVPLNDARDASQYQTAAYATRSAGVIYCLTVILCTMFQIFLLISVSDRLR